MYIDKSEVVNYLEELINDNEIEGIKVECKRIGKQKCSRIFGHQFEYTGGGSCSGNLGKGKDWKFVCDKCGFVKDITIGLKY
jgi:hypothetical protein